MEVKKYKSNSRNDKQNSGDNGNGNQNQKKNADADKDKTLTSFAQLTKGKIFCYCCGSPDHKSDKCSEKDSRPKDKWFKNMMESHLQTERAGSGTSEKKSGKGKGKDKDKDKDNYDESVKSDKTPRGWNNVQMVLNQNDVYNEETGGVVLLDTGSTMSIFRDSNWVEGIIKSSPIRMATNAGVRNVDKKANVPGFGEVWFDKEAIANIFGFADLAKKYRITYDSQEEDAFVVHTNEGKIKFTKTPEGLYAYKLTGKYKRHLKTEQNHLVDTVKENRMGLTTRQFQQAIKARELFHSLGCPSVENFITFVKTNGVRNCPIIIEDIRNAERVFGPDLGRLKGTSTRKKPAPVIHDWVDLPAEITKNFHSLVLCIDVMYINQVGFLTAIDKTIKYRSVIPIKANTAEELQ